MWEITELRNHNGFSTMCLPVVVFLSSVFVWNWSSLWVSWTLASLISLIISKPIWDLRAVDSILHNTKLTTKTIAISFHFSLFCKISESIWIFPIFIICFLTELASYILLTYNPKKKRINYVNNEIWHNQRKKLKMHTCEIEIKLWFWGYSSWRKVV